MSKNKKWTPKDIDYIKQHYGYITFEQLAENLDVTVTALQYQINKHKIKVSMQSEYAVYKDDDFICYGSLAHCAKVMGVKESSIIFFMSPSYQKRNETGIRVVSLGRWRVEDA